MPTQDDGGVPRQPTRQHDRRRPHDEAGGVHAICLLVLGLLQQYLQGRLPAGISAASAAARHLERHGLHRGGRGGMKRRLWANMRGSYINYRPRSSTILEGVVVV